jgi:predicted nucleic acid-binding protein
VTTRSKICVDASLIVALFVPERFSQASLVLWEEWVRDDYQLIAPLLLRYEVTSAIYRKSFRVLISVEDARRAIEQFLSLDIEYIDPPNLPLLAVDLAAQFHRPNTYDAHYLALAKHQECVVWTGDQRLYNAVKDGFDHINWIGDHPKAVSR